MAAVTSPANKQFLQFGFLTPQEVKLTIPGAHISLTYLPFLCVTKTIHSKASAYVSQGRHDLATGITCLDNEKKIKNPSKYLRLNHATVLNKIKHDYKRH